MLKFIIGVLVVLLLSVAAGFWLGRKPAATQQPAPPAPAAKLITPDLQFSVVIRSGALQRQSDTQLMNVPMNFRCLRILNQTTSHVLINRVRINGEYDAVPLSKAEVVGGVPSVQNFPIELAVGGSADFRYMVWNGITGEENGSGYKNQPIFVEVLTPAGSFRYSFH